MSRLFSECLFGLVLYSHLNIHQINYLVLLMLDFLYYVIVIMQDELEAGLEEFEGAELEEKLLQSPVVPLYVPPGRQSACPVPCKNTLRKVKMMN